jgi:Arc/MetJ-type ribon-helix-helix transcriptional regulator
MSRQQLSVRVPESIRDDIEDIQDRRNFDERSEATRQVLRRGIETYEGDSNAGETLGQQATTVAGVGTVAAVIGAGVGQSWAIALVTPFALTTFVFAMLWASVRVLAGRDLV